MVGKQRPPTSGERWYCITTGTRAPRMHSFGGKSWRPLFGDRNCVLNPIKPNYATSTRTAGKQLVSCTVLLLLDSTDFDKLAALWDLLLRMTSWKNIGVMLCVGQRGPSFVPCGRERLRHLMEEWWNKPEVQREITWRGLLKHEGQWISDTPVSESNTSLLPDLLVKLHRLMWFNRY